MRPHRNPKTSRLAGADRSVAVGRCQGAPGSAGRHLVGFSLQPPAWSRRRADRVRVHLVHYPDKAGPGLPDGKGRRLVGCGGRGTGCSAQVSLLPVAARPIGIPAVKDRGLLMRIRDVGARRGEVTGVDCRGYAGTFQPSGCTENAFSYGLCCFIPGMWEPNIQRVYSLQIPVNGVLGMNTRRTPDASGWPASRPAAH